MAIGTYSYRNTAGQDIWFIEGANVAKRSSPGNVHLLVIHDTDGTDSREYLRKNSRGVSAHYLVGSYQDVPGPRIYKYCSEASQASHTQGSALLGGAKLSKVNDVAISIEIEKASLSDAAVMVAAKLARSILDYWAARGRPLLMVGHSHIQHNKRDPRLDWHTWCKLVYG